MSSRERKRAELRKRKERGGGAAGQPDGGTEELDVGAEEARDAEAPVRSGTDAQEVPSPADLAAAAEVPASRSEARNEAARERLVPLEEGERPLVVTIGAVLSLLIALSIVGAWIAGVEVQVGNTDIEERPSAFQVFPPAILFAVMGLGMLRARYWAVLGFQAIMAIIMIGAFITLIAATSVFQAVSTFLVLAIAGTLFWFTVKALARIQMPAPGDPGPGR
ncbi:MAG: hypothetical protein R2718_05910 [Solirubrobacterales bacterium]|nr:hypothetical protein [Solirubrobacterales bacterium]